MNNVVTCNCCNFVQGLCQVDLRCEINCQLGAILIVLFKSGGIFESQGFCTVTISSGY